MRKMIFYLKKTLAITRNILLIAFIILLIGLATMFILNYGPLYKGPSSDHFDGRRFFNKEPDHSFFDMVKWMWEMKTVKWPEWINDPPQPDTVAWVKKGELKVTYINHATLLIQMSGVNILTDPIWSKWAGPFSWLGAKRVRAPGIKMNSLPKIDVIIISHDHYDHLDLPTLKQLAKRDQPVILVGLGVISLLGSMNFSTIQEMDWWQEYAIKSAGLKFTFVPAFHNSGRGLFGGNRTLWGGFVIEGEEGRVYFAGDTAYGPFLDKIKKRFADFRLTIFPIGNYEKRWFMKNQHMNPDDAVKAHRLLNSKQSVGMHYSTFLEHPEQTIDAHEKDLAIALRNYDEKESGFWILKFGEGREVPK
jgi:L-ascorbate metabolism protein UlaG (beta-lactamase superfamily)